MKPTISIPYDKVKTKYKLSKNDYRVLVDHCRSIMNKINRLRVVKNTNLPFIDENSAFKMIINYSKNNNVDILTAAKRTSMEVSQNTYKGDLYEHIR